MQASKRCLRTVTMDQHMCEPDCAVLEWQYLIVNVEIFDQRVPTGGRCVVEWNEWRVVQTTVEIHPVGRHPDKRKSRRTTPSSRPGILQLSASGLSVENGMGIEIEGEDGGILVLVGSVQAVSSGQCWR